MGGGRTNSIFEILANMDEDEYKRRLKDLVTDEAGAKWRPLDPNVSKAKGRNGNDVNNGQRKKKRPKKRANVDSDAPAVLPTKTKDKKNKKKSRINPTIENNSSKRKPRRRKN